MQNEESNKLNIGSQDNELNDDTENEENDSDDLYFEIMNYPADTTLKGYKELWENKQIKIPSFQRQYIWDQVRASKLIESFLLGLTVPSVFLYKERQGSKYLVIDGHQRIQTIISFFDGLFKNKKFILKGISPRWTGKSFKDLTEKDRFTLDTAVMRAIIIQQLKPDDNSSIYQIFERLNTGGINLNPMEVRMCVSEGKFVNMLIELNENIKWRQLLSRSKDPRSKDKEFILRILALHDRGNKYAKPMRKFLDQYIDDNRNPDDKIINFKKESFLKAVKKADYLNSKPFHLYNKLNLALMDSALVALMKSPLNDKNKLRDAYKKLLDNKEYIELVTYDASNKQRTAERLRIAKNAFNNE